MNVDQIYQLQRDDAFAAQFSAKAYQTFVAMPFSNRGGYPEPRIKSLLLTKVHLRANQLLHENGSNRQFAPLKRVDGETSGAVVITDQITREILYSHFFFGDLTGGNAGVVLETGIAMALKPNKRVLLFTQDDSTSLHFDLKVTNVKRYTEDDLVDSAAKELVSAAAAFEAESNLYVRFLSSQLTPDAITALQVYGELWKERKEVTDSPSLWEDSAASKSSRFQDNVGHVAFHQAIRELIGHRLMWTEFKPENGDYGIHATLLGWCVIEHLWKDDLQMRRPSNARTGPNFG